ncbi:MAG: NAD(P)-binding domain-containing protein [Spirosomataceae bacterium]
MTHTLIIGAGPFGLSLAAHLKQRGINCLVVGKPMEFWEKHMPEGMYLRSGHDWHLDADDVYTVEAFLKEKQLTAAQIEPIALDFYLQYVRWFIAHTQPDILPAYVTDVQKTADGFRVTTDNGQIIEAQNVVVAIGFQYFAYTPDTLTERLPAGRFSHTCHAVRLEEFTGKRVLLIGGRQSAFEWAALLRDKDAAHIHVSYRHDTPHFAEAHWGWVTDVVENIGQHPTWFRELSPKEKEDYRYRLWAEGRLKVEPWLEQRVRQSNVTLHPHTQVAKAEANPAGAVAITLDNGEILEADHIITATGYKVEIGNLPFLNPALLASIQCSNGFPHLDAHFQSNVPGLFFTSFMAGQDFGPFFGFTIAVRTAARLIGQQLANAIA